METMALLILIFADTGLEVAVFTFDGTATFVGAAVVLTVGTAVGVGATVLFATDVGVFVGVGVSVTFSVGVTLLPSVGDDASIIFSLALLYCTLLRIACRSLSVTDILCS